VGGEEKRGIRFKMRISVKGEEDEEEAWVKEED
jgi:hypothetical protein